MSSILLLAPTRGINFTAGKVKVKVILRPTVSRPVCSGIRPPSRTRDQFLLNLHVDCFQTVSALPLWGVLSDENTGQ
jgi:hypothetical protein